MAEYPHLGPWRLLPNAPGACPECAYKHNIFYPHNQQSITYQYRFFGTHGRWPTWKDAMAHCSPAMQAMWKAELLKKGVDVDKQAAEAATKKATKAETIVVEIRDNNPQSESQSDL